MEYYRQNNRSNFLSSIPTVTKNIIIINIIMFIATLINEDLMIRLFAMFYPASPFFHWWQPVTHMFMHGGFWHIFFNMYTLFLFGCVLERALGSRRFLIFYFVTGLGAVALHTFVQYLQVRYTGNLALVCSIPTVGASGAIYGILMGFAILYPNTVLTLLFPPVSLKAKWFVLIFGALELILGVTGTAEGVAHFAHLGGMVFALILMLFWKYIKLGSKRY
jgi:membrane associated rhomboid family serine protease